MREDLIAELRELCAIEGRPLTVGERARTRIAMSEAAAALEAAREDARALANVRTHLPTRVETDTLGDYTPEECAAFDAGYNGALDRAHNLLNRRPGAIAAIDQARGKGGAQ